MTATRPALDPVVERLVTHVAALRAALTRYRLSRDHRACVESWGLRGIDARCALCQAADEVLCDHV